MPELARLDNVATRGYLYIKESQGRIAADAIGVPFWKARHACGPDPECIRQRQLQAIAAYQADGAPISVPEAPAGDSPSSPTSLKMTLGPNNSGYIVDGVTLGSVVNTDSSGYKSLNCRSSQDFDGFTWCSKHQSETGKFGPYTSYLSFLYSNDNRITFVTQALVPAYFHSDDIDREIKRISGSFGQAQVLVADSRPGVPHAVLAAWGAVTLTPLDDEAMEALREGHEIHRGLVAEFIGDTHQSARLGLPVYKIGGGPGFIWGASFDDSGKGSLRISAVDASAVPSPQPPASPPLPYAAPAPSTPAPSTTSADDDARREKTRAERLDKVVQAATKQLNYVAQFIREHSANPKLLDYLDDTAGLKAAVEKGDPDIIERKSVELAAKLNQDQDYRQFDADQEKQRKSLEAQQLSDLVQRAKAQRAFLVDYAAKNPLASEVSTFLPLIKQLDPAIERPTLDQMQRLTGQIDLAIREASLDEAFRSAQAEPQKPALQPESPHAGGNQNDAQLHATDKNRFLLEGDLNDVLILFNAGAKAPHVAVNLRGQFVFADDAANVCLFGDNPDFVALTVQSELSPYKIKAFTGLDQKCDPQKLETYDVVVTQRGAFLRSAKADALSLIKQIERDSMRQLTLVPAAHIAAVSDAERAAIDQIASDVAAGARSGFGVILLKTASANLCVVVEDKSEAHKQLILRNMEKLTFDMRVAPTVTPKSADDAFVATQKMQCGAVYASARDLKVIGEAMDSAKIPFSFSSLWITPLQLEAKDAELIEKRKLDEQQSFKRKQEEDDEARLQEQRDKDREARQSEQQSKLRAQYGGLAKSAVADIVADVAKLEQSDGGPAQIEFPQFAAWLTTAKSDHWELMMTDTDVLDYGVSDFKGRMLDTAFARMSIHLRNAILGKYEDSCFVFVRMIDEEFHMVREPAVAHCEDTDAVKLWQADHKFESRWVVGD